MFSHYRIIPVEKVHPKELKLYKRQLLEDVQQLDANILLLLFFDDEKMYIPDYKEILLIQFLEYATTLPNRQQNNITGMHKGTKKKGKENKTRI